jgi:hypothetical protein
MPVMGPNYSDKQVQDAYDAVMDLLKEKFRIQAFPPPKYPDYGKNRVERNTLLRKAIEGLVELESWESW